MKLLRFVSITAVLAFSGCAHSPVATEGGGAQLRAVLSPNKQTFRTSVQAELQCTIRNVSKSPIQADTFPLGFAQLSLDVFDASGQRLAPMPPPMPPDPDDARLYLKILRPGDTLSETYSLNMFSPPLKPGTYTARMRGIESNEVAFTIERAPEH